MIVEILRALMRAVPHAAPVLRDGFILDRLLEMSGRVTGAASAGAEAMKSLSDALGAVDDRDVHSAAATALRRSRAAAIQEHAPWPGATLEDMEETAMALCETLRAYGSLLLARDTKGMIRDACAQLVRADLGLLEPSYRDVMRASFASLFPADVLPAHSAGVAGHGEWEGHGGGGAESFAGVDAELAAEFAAAREAGGGLPSPAGWHAEHAAAISNAHAAASAHDARAAASAAYQSMMKSGASLFKGMGMGLGGTGSTPSRREGSAAAAGVADDAPPAAAARERRNSASNAGAPPVMSLAAFGAAAPVEAPAATASVRRNSGAAPAATQEMGMAAFMSGPPAAPPAGAAPAHPPPHPPTKPPGTNPNDPKAGGWTLKGMAKVLGPLS